MAFLGRYDKFGDRISKEESDALKARNKERNANKKSSSEVVNTYQVKTKSGAIVTRTTEKTSGGDTIFKQDGVVKASVQDNGVGVSYRTRTVTEQNEQNSDSYLTQPPSPAQQEQSAPAGYVNYMERQQSVDRSKIQPSIIRTYDEEGNVIGITDTVAGISMGAEKGKVFNENNLRIIEAKRTENDRANAQSTFADLRDRSGNNRQNNILSNKEKKQQAIQIIENSMFINQPLSKIGYESTKVLTKDLIITPAKGAYKYIKSPDYMKGYMVLTDKDVQTFGITGSLVVTSAGALGKVGQVIADSAIVVSAPLTGYEFGKNPNVETGTRAVVTTAFGIGATKGLTGTALKKIRLVRAEPIEPNIIFSEQVLVQGKQFPTTRSGKETYNLFQKTKDSQGNIYGVSASSQPIKGNVVGVGGGASKAGTQDPGIYVTPLGEGSPYFLMINQQKGFSFNPFASGVNNPTASIFKASDVVMPSSRALKEPGFSRVVLEQQQLKDAGVFQITKRSITRQTSEIEAVIPVNTELAWNPNNFFSKKTIYKGESVGIREATLIKTKDLTSSQLKQLQNEGYKFGSLKDFQSDASSKLYGRSVPVRLSGSFNTPDMSLVTGSIPSFETPSSVNVVSSSGSSSYVLSKGFVPPSNKSYSKSSSSKLKASVSIKDNSYSSESGKKSAVSKSSTKTGSTIPSSSGSSYSEPISSSVTSFTSSKSKPKPLNSSFRTFYNNAGSSTTNIFNNLFTKGRERQSSDFSVFVREKGAFKIFGRGLSKKDAVARGITATTNTPSASFKVFKGGELLGFEDLELDKRFRRSKRERGVAVEKAKFRINTPGELSGITFKGLKNI